jgi:cytochrome c-type biogenesis protein
MGEAFAELVRGGPLLLAVGAAMLAGLVSFLSPCVLPLVPGYLSYVTGLAGADLAITPALASARAAGSPQTRPVGEQSARSLRSLDSGPPAAGGAPAGARPRGRRRASGRVLAGTLLFVAGFAAVFTAMAILVAGVGGYLFRHSREIEVAGGVLIILLGLAFLGLVPGAERQWRINRLPDAGLLGAPVFGAVFALSWVPCVSPTLGAVLTLASVGGQTDRAVVLALAYCLGLGLPFVAFGLGFRRLLGVFTVIRRNSRWVTRVGGALLILVGLALLTGGWTDFVIWLRGLVGTGEVGI